MKPRTSTGDRYGLVDPATGIWHLYWEDQEASQFYFGNPGDFPFMGDWDCDAIDTPGLYRQSDGYVYLRNSNTQGIADVSFFFGNPGDVPIAGDFNGDGCDTVSIYRPSNQMFYIINELGTNDGGLGAAEYSFMFGNPGDKPFIGDFNGNGQDTVGLHRESTGFVYYRNTLTTGIADNDFFYGDPGDRFVAGDWTGNGFDSPGLFRPSNTTMYLRYENTQGNADESWVAGEADWLPVAGLFPVPAPPPTADQGSIVGVVTEKATGTPLSEIAVDVIEYTATGSVHRTTTTVADGSYAVDGLDAGIYDVFFEDGAEGYVSGSDPGVQVDPGATTTANMQLVSWATANQGSIVGVVTERGTGTPLPGIEVMFDSPQSYPKYTSTATDGTYAASGLDPGVYDVIFADNNGVYVDKGVHNVQLEPAATTTVNMELVSWAVANAGSISGVVTAAGTGTPIPGVSITVYLPGSDLLERTKSAVDGTYEVDNLPPGSYGVDFALMTPLYEAGSVSGVTVDRDKVTLNLELTLKQGPIEVEALVTRYAPEIRFHPGEQFFMADPVTTLDLSRLTYGWLDAESFSFAVAGSDPTSADTLMSDVETMLSSGVLDDPLRSGDPGYYIEIPDALRGGYQPEAVVNVRILPVGEYLDLQYWFFYPFNGHGWSRVQVLGLGLGSIPGENSSKDTQIGRHYGDWEHITVHVSKDTLELHSVYLSRHAGGYWYTPDELNFVDGTPSCLFSQVYPCRLCRSGPTPLWLGRGWRCWTRRLRRDGGVRFQTWAPGATNIFSSALPGFEVEQPEWLQFQGRWGEYLKNHYTHWVWIVPLFAAIPVWSDTEFKRGTHRTSNRGAVGGDIDTPPH